MNWDQKEETYYCEECRPKSTVFYTVVVHTPFRFLSADETASMDKDENYVHERVAARTLSMDEAEAAAVTEIGRAMERITEAERDPERTYLNGALEQELDEDGDGLYAEPPDLMDWALYEEQVRQKPLFPLVGKVHKQYFYKYDDGLMVTILASESM